MSLRGIKLSDAQLLYRGTVKTKSGERLKSSGGIIYTRMQERLQENWFPWDIHQIVLVSTICKQVVPLQPPKQECQTGCSKGMVGGRQTELRMATLKIRWRKDWECQIQFGSKVVFIVCITTHLPALRLLYVVLK